MRKLKVMADFSSNGIWDEYEGGLMVEFDELGLPTELIKEFEDWIIYYDTCWKDHFSVMIPEKMKVCNEIGRTLAIKLKQLFPIYEIEFWAEDNDGMKKEVINA